MYEKISNDNETHKFSDFVFVPKQSMFLSYLDKLKKGLLNKNENLDLTNLKSRYRKRLSTVVFAAKTNKNKRRDSFEEKIRKPN